MSTGPNPARRSEASKDAILTACLTVIRDPGRRLSIEAIAREAGVGKQTIYRWWPSLGAVLADAVARERDRWPVHVTDSGDLFDDLGRVLRGTARQMRDPHQAPVLAALFAQMQTDPTLRAAFAAAAFGPVRGAHRRRLDAARAAGELTTDLSDDEVLDLLFGPLWFRFLTRPDEVTEGFAVAVLDTVRAALLRP